MVEGSGTGAVAGVDGMLVTTVTPPGVVVTSRPPLKPLLPARLSEQTPERVLLFSVTAPVAARALPQRSVAVLFMAMLVCARMFPRNVVFVSIVAELRTFQKTPAPEPVLTRFTTELGEVISELSIWNTQAALALPCPSRVSAPDRLVVPAGTV